MRINKNIFVAALIIGALAAPGSAVEPKAVAAAVKAVPVFAVVNGEEIRQPEFNTEWTALLAQAKKALKPEQMTPEWEKNQKAMLLNQLVDQRLLAQEAKKKGVVAAKKDVDAALRKVKNQFKPADGFQKELAKENITEKQFTDRISNQLRVVALTNGVIKERVKVPTAEQIRKLFDSVKEKLAQPDSDEPQQAELNALARYFRTNLAERVKIQYMLFKADDKSTPEQRAAASAKAAEVKAKLDAGANFADTAIEYSEDKVTGPKGGEAGFIVRGQMIKDFEDAVFAIPVGAVSGVIETKLGYQIVRVKEKTAAADFRYEEAREYLANHLVRVAAREELSSYVQALKKTAVIDLRADFAKS